MHQDAVGWTKIGASGTILGISAVSQNNGDVVLFDVGTDGSMSRFSLFSGWSRPMGAPGTIQSISAGQDLDGTANVFVIASDGSFTEFKSSSGWLRAALGAPGTVAAISATTGNRVTVIGTDGSIVCHDDRFGWYPMAGPGFARALSVSDDGMGHAVIYAVTLQDALFRHDDATGWTQIGGASTIGSVSAGTDAANRAVVFAQTKAGDMAVDDSFAGWSMLSPPSSIAKLSATSMDQIFAVLADGSIVKHDDKLGMSFVAGPGFARA
jgi:hypothetical protein